MILLWNIFDFYLGLGWPCLSKIPLLVEETLTYMHSYPRIHAPYHEHVSAFIFHYDSELRSVGTILLVLSSVAPVGLMTDMESGVGETSGLSVLYLSFLTVVAVHGILTWPLFWIQSGFIFLLVMCSAFRWSIELVVSDMTGLFYKIKNLPTLW